ncbi:hypothetical protein [Mucilaginibacter gossypiicola]|nr:hypothetical protein [Mucilaginibacter gossypiicola]
MAAENRELVANKFDKGTGTVLNASTKADGAGCPIKWVVPLIQQKKIIVTEEDGKVVENCWPRRQHWIR